MCRVILRRLALLTAFNASADSQAQQKENDKPAVRRAVLDEQWRANEERKMAACVRQLEQQIDRQIFQPYGGSPSEARKQMDSHMTVQIEEIDRACSLTLEQKKKLNLLGRGDIKRFFDRYEGIQQKLGSVKTDPRARNEIFQEVLTMQLGLHVGPFHDSSIFRKAVKQTLTDGQFARYDAITHKRRKAHHLEIIDAAVARVERTLQVHGKPLIEAQRRELVMALKNETEPSWESNPYESYCMMFQLGRLPEEKLKALFNDAQLVALNQHLAQLKELESLLKQSGLLWDDDKVDRTTSMPKPAM